MMPFSPFCPNFDVQLIFVIQEMAYIYLFDVDFNCMVTGHTSEFASNWPQQEHVSNFLAEDGPGNYESANELKHEGLISIAYVWA